jgi:hypothetical protein
VALTVFCLAYPARSVAQSAGDSLEYRAWIHDAIREYETAHYREAFELFLRAHRAAPTARTLRGLGMAAFELADYVDAVTYISSSLASTDRPLEGQMRADAQQLLARAQAYVGWLVLRLEPTGLAGLHLSIDEQESELRPGVPYAMVTGDHTLLVEAPNHEPVRRQFEIRGATTSELTLSLKAPSLQAPALAPSSLKGVSAPEPGSPSERPLRRSPWLWGAVGAGAAGAIVAGVLLGMRSGAAGTGAKPGDFGGVIETAVVAP